MLKKFLKLTNKNKKINILIENTSIGQANWTDQSVRK